MSQAKVDEYKKQKANREKIMKREKRILFLEKLLGVVVVAAVVFWIGFSIYRYGGSAANSENAEISYAADVDLSAVYDFSSALADAE